MITMNRLFECDGSVRFWKNEVYGIKDIHTATTEDIDMSNDAYSAFAALADALKDHEETEDYQSKDTLLRDYEARRIEWLYEVSKDCPLSEEEGPFSFTQENDMYHPVWFFSVPFALLESKGLIQKKIPASQGE